MNNRCLILSPFLVLLIVFATSCGKNVTVTVPVTFSTLTTTATYTKMVTSATPTYPQPPAIPQAVLDIWKLPPANSTGNPPSISKQVTLQPYGKSGDSQTVDLGYYQDYTWMDIIIKCSGTIVEFQNSNVGQIWLDIGSSTNSSIGIDGYQSVRDYQGNPLLGYKYLFSSLGIGWVETNTNTGYLYTTGLRLFNDHGVTRSTNGGCNYNLFLSNNSLQQATVTYEVYKLSGYTPNWGVQYIQNTLDSWSKQMAQTGLSDEQLKQIYLNWENQFNK